MKVKVGKVKHFYDKIGVAVIELSSKLSSGDRISFEKDQVVLSEQTVESMQVEHEKIDSAKKGDMVGLKVLSEVTEGAEIFKL